MILRELLAVFGLEFQDKGSKKAAKSLGSLQDQTQVLANTMSTLLTAGAMAAPFLALAKMASDAQESLNLVDVAFSENGATVIKWAEESAVAIGRSKFTMIDLASQLGAVVRPMLGSADAASEMSMRLTELAVDLGSVFNKSEADSIRAVISAMTGEQVAIKRFGIVMNEASLGQFALTQGITKTVKAMNAAEKTQLRFNFLMSQGSIFLGDTAKTQFQFANSTRAMMDALKDIGTELGLFLIPAFEKSLIATRELLKPVVKGVIAFKEFAASTELAGATVKTLSLLMGATLLPTLFKMLPFLAAFAAFVFIMDDVITAFKGGNSVLLTIAKTMDALEKEGFPGMNKGLALVLAGFNRFRDGVGAVMAFLVSIWESFMEGSLQPVMTMMDTLNSSLIEYLEGLGKWGKAAKAILNALVNPLLVFGGVFAGVMEAIATGSVEPLKAALEGVKGIIKDTEADFQGAFGTTPSTEGGAGIGTPTAEIPVPRAPESAASSGLPLRTLQGIGLGIERFLGFGAGATPAAPSTLGPVGGGARSVTVNQGAQTLQFNVTQQPGESTEEFVSMVGDIVDERNQERDKEVFNSLVQTAGAAL